MEHVRKMCYEGDLKSTVTGQYEVHDFWVLWFVKDNKY